MARNVEMWHEVMLLWHEMKNENSKIKIQKSASKTCNENSKKIIIIKLDLFKSSCLF